jgi:hypothetical protein
MMHNTKATEKDLDITQELPKLPTKEPKAAEDNTEPVAEVLFSSGSRTKFHHKR